MKYIYFFLSLLLFSCVALTSYVLWQIPSSSEIRGCLKTSMFAVDLCPGSKDYVSLDKISKNLQNAVILSEDGHFWQHAGFDWVSLQETAEKNMKKGKIVRGGSTITQQLAKNLFLNRDKSYKRKFFEALITMKIESTLTKKEILERYLNVIEYGKDIYGVKKAAQYYFKKSPKELDAVESAFLAMILPNPKKYSSSFYKKELTRFAKGRISRIVGDMYRTGSLSEANYESAKIRMQTLFGVPYKEEDLIDEALTLTQDSAPDTAPADSERNLFDEFENETTHLLREDNVENEALSVDTEETSNWQSKSQVKKNKHPEVSDFESIENQSEKADLNN